MAVYEHPSSKTHIQITSSSPSGSSDTRMMAGSIRGLESFGASLPFHMFQLMNFHPTLLSDLSVCFNGLNHLLHKSRSGISHENIIKMFHKTAARQKDEKARLLNCLLPLLF